MMPKYISCLQKAAGYGAIRLVQMKGADSDWMGMTNKYGQAWEVPVTPKLPWDFRIVSDDGQEVSYLPQALLSFTVLVRLCARQALSEVLYLACCPVLADTEDLYRLSSSATGHLQAS